MESLIQKTSLELGKDANRDSSDPVSGLCDFEEYGTLWLFGYKELLNWQVDIQWLFSPVTGKYPLPGDLWGIDRAGNLIIVETKLSKTRVLQDPFLDFVGFEKKLKIDRLQVLGKEFLSARWKKLLKKELEFIEQYSPSLERGTNPFREFSGIVPYSRKRFAVWRWRLFYLRVIVPSMQRDYEEVVLQYLSEREENPLATQHYFGVLVASSDTEPKLSGRGLQNYEQLCAEVGSGRVHLCKIQALCIDDTVQLSSRVT